MADEERGEIEARPESAPTVSSDWLARRGGWLLAIAGAGLIALATVFASKATIAPVFAVGGIALFVLGVLLPRVQGKFEFSATGFSLFLVELKEQTRDLDAAAKAEVLDEIIEAPGRIERATSSPSSARREATTLAATARRGSELEEEAVRWLASEGWTVESNVVLPTGEVDIIAKRGADRLYGDVRLRLDNRVALNVRRQVDRLSELADPENRGSKTARIALFLGERPRPASVTRLVQSNEAVEIYVRLEDRTFERVP